LENFSQSEGSPPDVRFDEAEEADYLLFFEDASELTLLLDSSDIIKSSSFAI